MLSGGVLFLANTIPIHAHADVPFGVDWQTECKYMAYASVLLVLVGKHNANIWHRPVLVLVGKHNTCAEHKF